MKGRNRSGTSAYFSVDVGLIHIAALSKASPIGAELDWLTKDLEAANANRGNVPVSTQTICSSLY